jgi:hypothetical protein
LEEQICDPARSPGIVPFWPRGFVLPNAAMPARPNRSRLLGRTPHCYSLLCIVIFRCFSLLFARAGTPGKSAQSRVAQGEMRRFSPTPALLFHCY